MLPSNNSSKQNITLFILLISLILNVILFSLFINSNTKVSTSTRASRATCESGCKVGDKCLAVGVSAGKLQDKEYCCFAPKTGGRAFNYYHLDICGSTSNVTVTPVKSCRATIKDKDVQGRYGTVWCNKCAGGISYSKCGKGSEGLYYRCVGNNSPNPQVPVSYRNGNGNFYALDDEGCRNASSITPTTTAPTIRPGEDGITSVIPSSVSSNLCQWKSAGEKIYIGGLNEQKFCYKCLSNRTDDQVPIFQIVSCTTTPTESPEKLKKDFDTLCTTLDEADGCLRMGCNGIGMEGKVCTSYYSASPINNTKASSPHDCINEVAVSTRFIDANRCTLKF